MGSACVPGKEMDDSIMADTHITNYPDVFGYITTADRQNIGPVQVALATRPRTVKAGRQFEVIMLIQNATDAKADVTVDLQLPQKDHKGQRGRFISGQTRLMVSLQPAEVGYAVLPMATMPDTAIGSDYMVGMEVSARTTSKGGRVRGQAGGAAFNPGTVSDEKRQRIEDLTQLSFSTQKRGMLRGNTLETPINVIQGKIGQRPELQPGWVSLWTLDDQNDLELLLDKYAGLLRHNVLPGLKRERLYQPLAQKTFARFKASGYTLTKEEAVTATRLLLVALELATGQADGVSAANLDVMGVLRRRERDRARIEKARLIDEDVEMESHLPNWAVGYLQLLAKDERLARVPHKVIPELLYDELLSDALFFAMHIVERDGGESLGDDEEMRRFTALVMEKLAVKGEMDFTHAYLPWIMGGIIVTDKALIGEEKLADAVRQMRFMVDERARERDEDNEPVFDMASRIMDQTLKKYGMLNNR